MRLSWNTSKSRVKDFHWSTSVRKVWRSVRTGSVLESPWRAGALTLQTGAEMGIKRFPRLNLILCVCVYACVCAPVCVRASTPLLLPGFNPIQHSPLLNSIFYVIAVGPERRGFLTALRTLPAESGVCIMDMPRTLSQ